MRADRDPFAARIGARASAILRRTVGRRYRLTELSGDASTRRFLRARGARGAAVLMLHPEPLDPSSPLYSNYRVLRAIGAPVPRLLGSDDAAGVVVVGDLGETTLQRHLARPGRAAARQRRRLYRQACDLIALLQVKGSRALRPGDFAARHALDRERFLLELDHFHHHFVHRLRGMRPSPGESAVLRAFYTDLAARCDRQPRVYCHRDFQSRNLMVRRGRIHLIDFQDARMGPYTYDAASLLRDSSLDLDERLADELAGYLAGRLGLGTEEFRSDLDLMALQRNIKDLGTFAYQTAVRLRRDYLSYIPRAIRLIRRCLTRRRLYHPIYAILEEFILSYPP
ncbi:MAG: aminoglycoside phosphotransferase family protein [Acidobacteriota bacterium]